MYQLFDIFASLAKTDISRHELVESDHSDLDSIENRIRRKPNRHEDQPDRNSLMANSPLILRRWLAFRQDAIKINIPAPLLIAEGEPLNRSGVHIPVNEAARRAVLHVVEDAFALFAHACASSPHSSGASLLGRNYVNQIHVLSCSSLHGFPVADGIFIIACQPIVPAL